MRDFFAILEEGPDNNPYFSKTEFVYRRPDWKGYFEFFGADDSAKTRGPRRSILFVNEGNNIPWETVRNMDIRTSHFTIVDWNPVSEFWAHEYESGDGKLIPGWIHDKTTHYVHSTYLDALHVLPQQLVNDIESYRDKDPNWWNIYGLGLLGKVEELVHPNFDQVDELPAGDCFFGLDFGFSGDPAVLTKHVIIGDELYSQELIYQRNMTNDSIAREMILLGMKPHHDEIFADAAEPKSIQEIYDKGFNIKPCEKGPGSVEFGIQKINQFRQHWTKDSTNCIKEQRNYRYIRDKDNKLTEKTTHQWSHGMDSRRYAVSSKVFRPKGPSPKPQRF
jgi:phage terminase large subunit